MRIDRCLLGVGLVTLAAISASSVHFAWSSVLGAIDSGSAIRSVMAEGPIGVAALQLALGSEFHGDHLVNQPLFSPGRRVVVPPPVVPPPVQPVVKKDEAPPPAYVVGGVILSSSTRKVLLRGKQRENGVWVNQGEATKEGWSVVSINAGAIVLGRGERRITLPLSSTRSSQTTVTAAKAAGPTQPVE